MCHVALTIQTDETSRQTTNVSGEQCLATRCESTWPNWVEVVRFGFNGCEVVGGSVVDGPGGLGGGGQRRGMNKRCLSASNVGYCPTTALLEVQNESGNG